jgi:hypothetical protein
MSEQTHYIGTGKLGISFWLNAPVLKTIRFLNGIRELSFTGITIGQIGIGVLISRKAKGGE